jgi:hypothetical protein
MTFFRNTNFMRGLGSILELQPRQKSRFNYSMPRADAVSRAWGSVATSLWTAVETLGRERGIAYELIELPTDERTKHLGDSGDSVRGNGECVESGIAASDPGGGFVIGFRSGRISIGAAPNRLAQPRVAQRV